MHASLEYFIFKGSKTLINCVSVSRFVLPCLIDAGESSVVFHNCSLARESLLMGPDQISWFVACRVNEIDVFILYF